MRICHKCKEEKISSEMFLVIFRKLGIQAKHGVKVGYSNYFCDDCLKLMNIYEDFLYEEFKGEENQITFPEDFL